MAVMSVCSRCGREFFGEGQGIFRGFPLNPAWGKPVCKKCTVDEEMKKVEVEIEKQPNEEEVEGVYYFDEEFNDD